MDSLHPSTEKNVHESILGAIGPTPLVRLARVAHNVAAPIYAKLENLNPGGSIKDRVGLHIIEQAERRGELKTGRARSLRPLPAILEWASPSRQRSRATRRSSSCPTR